MILIDYTLEEDSSLWKINGYTNSSLVQWLKQQREYYNKKGISYKIVIHNTIEISCEEKDDIMDLLQCSAIRIK